jgi:anti-sigma28 factor (negative regulator of flagellin synthesis)
MIGNIHGSLGNTPIDPINIKKYGKDTASIKVEDKGVDAPLSQDTVEISKEAQTLGTSVADLKVELNKVPDVRAKKIELARDRIQEGFYDKKEVAEDTAEIILKEFKAGS